MDMIKIAVMGVAAVLLSLQLRSGKREFELFIVLGACLCIFGFLLTKLEVVIQAVNQMQSYVHLDAQYVAILIKMIGITYVAEFSANLCRDAGYQAVAVQIEMFGKLSILAISMPVLLALLQMVSDFLQ